MTTEQEDNMEKYYMPAEWKPHLACLIFYPHNEGVFRSSSVGTNYANNSNETTKCDLARAQVRNVARAVRDYGKEDVFLFCNTPDAAEELTRLLQREEKKHNGDDDESKKDHKIIVKVCPSDDSWCRDTGPTFVYADSDGDDGNDRCTMVGLDWEFNAYGGEDDGCYWPCNFDKAIPKTVIPILSDQYSIPIQHIPVPNIVLEGGSIHTDGEGTILTTEECLLNKNRNPNLSKDQIESILLHYLGAQKVIWLPLGLAFDDDTNGHVDNIATFARPGEVVLSWTDDEADENYHRFHKAQQILFNEVDAKGRKIKVIRLHIPRPMFYTKEEVETLSNKEDDGDETCVDRMIGQRLAGSYVNYYMANSAIILPQFGDAVYDDKARDAMKETFPDLEIVPVQSREILLGGGNIHCITQQLPTIRKNLEVNDRY